MVAAAGNEGSCQPFYPASYAHCLAVGATDKEDARAFFSNYGPWVNIFAPGVDILSTTPSHSCLFSEYGVPLNYAGLMGTSMAAPQVAATAALLWSRYPSLTPAEVWDLLVKGAGSDGRFRFASYKVERLQIPAHRDSRL